MRYRRPITSTAVIAVVAVSLLAAGCGSSAPSASNSSNSSNASNASNATNASSSGNQSGQAQSIQPAINFADCMRSHRVGDFPDPASDPHAFKQSLDPSLPHSPVFVTAVKACRHLLPGPGPNSQSDQHSPTQIAAALAFARCLRTHGFPSFPDPTSTGDITHQMLASAGINVHQPAVVQAADACAPVTHGYITRADVARFIAGQ